MTEDILCPNCGKKIDPSVDYNRVGGMCEPEGTTGSDTLPEICPFCGEKL
jgi:hypothetical protein